MTVIWQDSQGATQWTYQPLKNYFVLENLDQRRQPSTRATCNAPVDEEMQGLFRSGSGAVASIFARWYNADTKLSSILLDGLQSLVTMCFKLLLFIVTPVCLCEKTLAVSSEAVEKMMSWRYSRLDFSCHHMYFLLIPKTSYVYKQAAKARLTQN